jgi:cob(I)alamin adenosyltransferase
VKLYTRTGDSGETSLFGKTRVSKADARVDAYGEVDELGAWIGFVRTHDLDPDMDDVLLHVQRDLFALGAQLADPSEKIAERLTKAFITDDDVTRLETMIDRFDSVVPPLSHFILSGGGPAGAALHIARTVCRRVERRIVALTPAVDSVLVRYVNRLSDLLFAMARAANHRSGRPETAW